MSFKAWLNRETFKNRWFFWWRRWFRHRNDIRKQSAILSVLAIAPYIAIWVEPKWLPYAVIFLSLILSFKAWYYLGHGVVSSWYAVLASLLIPAAVFLLILLPIPVSWLENFWPSGAIVMALALILAIWGIIKSEQSRDWLTAIIPLVIYWAGTFVFWLFLENPFYRVLMLVMLVIVGWWYLVEWQRVGQGGTDNTLETERGAGVTPTLALGLISAFTLTSSAESFLVFLDVPVWLLLLTSYIPITFSFISFCRINRWSFLSYWRYWLAGIIILLELFILITWWPTSFYVVGFIMASCYFVLVLSLRQEAQGFINRRPFTRELVILTFLFILVLLTARWF